MSGACLPVTAMNYLEYFKEYVMRNEKDPLSFEDKVKAGYACETKRVRFIFFDLETSPSYDRKFPNANEDSIIEIGAVSEQGSFSKLCNPGHPVYSTVFNGITTEDVERASHTQDVLKEFLTWIIPGDEYDISLLVAHNAFQFDMKLLRVHITKYFPNMELDDIYVADSIYPLKKRSGASSGKLETIYRHIFGQDYMEKHRAVEDAKDLKRITEHICETSGISCSRILSDYVYPLKTKNEIIQYFNVPFSEKDIAKTMGAKWDTVKKLWYAQTLSIAETLEKKFSKKII